MHGRGWGIVAIVIAGCSSSYGSAELPDAGSTADASAGGRDAGADAYDAPADASDASDATAACPHERAAPPPPLACPPTNCFGSDECCLDPGTSACTASCPAPAIRHSCDGPDGCLSTKCCVEIRGPLGAACPASVPLAIFGGTSCTPTECSEIQYLACQRSADCPPGRRCEAIVVTTATGDLPLGVCR